MSVEVQRMRINTDTKCFFNRVFDSLDPWVAKFYDLRNFFVRILFVDHQMVVLLIEI